MKDDDFKELTEWANNENLRDFPTSKETLLQLTELNFEYSQLKTLPDSIGELKGLRRINLGANKYRRLPDSLFTLANLKSITISDRDVGKLLKYTDGLMALKEIKIVKVGVPMGGKVLPIEITKLTKLESLSFDYPFVTLPSGIENLSVLKSLIVPKNLDVTESQKIWILDLLKRGCKVMGGEMPQDEKPEWLEELIKEKNMPAMLAIKSTIKLTVPQIEKFFEGYEILSFHNSNEVMSNFSLSYRETINEVHPSSSELKSLSKEEVFMYLDVRPNTEDILLLSCFEAYVKQEPQLILDGYYSKDHLVSIQNKRYPDTISPLDILNCYSGNNYRLAEYYIDNNFGNYKTDSYGRSIFLFLRALRDKKLNEDAIASIGKFLSRKSTNKFDKSFFVALKAILLGDMELFSENLESMVKYYPKIVGSNYFINPMSAYLPSLAYALYSVAFHHLESSLFDKIKEPKLNIWWHDFVKLNIKNGFSEGKSYITFKNDLEFLNRKIY